MGERKTRKEMRTTGEKERRTTHQRKKATSPRKRMRANHHDGREPTQQEEEPPTHQEKMTGNPKATQGTALGRRRNQGRTDQEGSIEQTEQRASQTKMAPRGKPKEPRLAEGETRKRGLQKRVHTRQR